MEKIAVLLSGSGTTFQAVYESTQNGLLKGVAEIVAVISDKENAYGLERARKVSIPIFVSRKKDYASNEEYENALLKIIENVDATMICLMGYLKLLPAKIINRFPNKVLNSHPGALQEFGGKGMYGERVHAAVLRYAQKYYMPYTCATIHLVNERYDEGPIIKECWIPITDKEGKMLYDNPSDLQKAVLPFEYPLYISAIASVAAGTAREIKHKPIPKNNDEQMAVDRIKKEVADEYDAFQKV
ncbi:MAG: phosphoribosylglycinamide formyltransferase [Parcubacteria group bacterium]|nr:phosphoribosylglycinamide formyltransferase [Parcubacteria group bacterium]